MEQLTMGLSETRFAEIIWENEPITPKELCKLSGEKLGWKKTTSYTVLKRLCNKGIFLNDNGKVTSVIKKDEFYSLRSESFLKENFGGSLPAFVAAFTARNSLSPEEAAELRRLAEKFEDGAE